MTLEQAQQLIGKRVIVENAVNGKSIGGILEFVGPNTMLNWPLQVTVDRMPIQIENLNQISPQEIKSIFDK